MFLNSINTFAVRGDTGFFKKKKKKYPYHKVLDLALCFYLGPNPLPLSEKRGFPGKFCL